MIVWIYFIINILIAVILHELGHLIASVLLGVKVKTYSIGFGNPCLHKKILSIDFRITPWLLGGYVSLEGESDKSPNGFLAQRYYKKVIILLAGVAVNALLAIIGYLVVYKSISLGLWVDWNMIKSIFTRDYSFLYLVYETIIAHPFLTQLTLINFMLIISNLLPFPALDGGGIWTLWLEKIWKKDFPRLWTLLNKIGFILFNAIVIIGTLYLYKDFIKFNPLDLIATIIVLSGLIIIPKNRSGWLVYCIGCLLWMYLTFLAGYYFGTIMNLVAIGIAVKNYKVALNKKADRNWYELLLEKYNKGGNINERLVY